MENKPEIYLDHNASAPLRPEALQALQPWLGKVIGNPSSTHLSGQQARHVIEKSRETIARALHCSADEIIFTSGGTEANNLAIKGIARGRKGALVLPRTEHPSVLRVMEAMVRHGREIRWLEVNAAGEISLDDLRRSLEGAALVALMAANNETGVIHPIEEAARLCIEARVPLHCDAVQAVGKLPFDLEKVKVTYLTASGHKFGSLAGVGFLFVRKGENLLPSTIGGEQEKGFRAGTENTLGILSMAAALQAACGNQEKEQKRQAALRDQLQNNLLKEIKGLRIFSSKTDRVANTLLAGFPGVASDVMILRLDQVGVRISAGAACSAGAVKASHVLKAMGVDDSTAAGVLRFSLGPLSTEQAVTWAGRQTVSAWRDLTANP